MRLFLLPLLVLYRVYSFTLFVILMLPIFLWSLFALLFGKVRSGNMVWAGCKAWADTWFLLIFIWHRNIYIEKPDPHQSYIFVANHTTYLDAAVIPKIFRRPARPLGKVEISRVPVFGTIYKNAIVAVDRSSPENRAQSVKELKALLQLGISVIVFPEGTFNTSGKALKNFYDGAFRIAIETGTPIKPVVILDMYDRMHTDSVFSLNPGRSRAVFLPEVLVDGLSLEDTPALKQRVYDMMEAELKKRRASWIREV